MRRSVELDSETEAKLSQAIALTKKDPTSLLVLAIQVGLPSVANELNAERPEGYFAADYGEDKERVDLENAMTAFDQHPER